MKIKFTLSGILFLSTLFLGILNAHAQIEFPQGNFDDLVKTGTAKVTEIQSPLAVKLDDGRVIHLAGIDYPDLDYFEPGEISLTAQKILEDHLTNELVTIYQTKDKKEGRLNRFGHHIAHLQKVNDETWTQGILLSLGAARTRTTKYNPEMVDQMLALENTARKNKFGLWADDRFPILPPEKTLDKIGTYQIVEGKVRSVSMHKNRLYLNFGNDWRDDFTVSIPAFDLRQFTKKLIYPEQWNDKNIRVRGWIRSYNGPYMEINHPERFENLSDKKEEKQESVQPKPTEENSDNALPGFNR